MTPQTTPRIGGNFQMLKPETKADRMTLWRPDYVYRGGWTNRNHIDPTHPVDVAWMQDQQRKRVA